MLPRLLALRSSLRRSPLRSAHVAPLAALAFGMAASPARAADPTPADCLSAADASLASQSAHRLRRERFQVLLCASAACPAEIRKECMRRVDEVTALVPTIVFEATDPAGRDLDAVRVTMDGEALTDQLDGTALPVDPGAHTFRFEAASQAPIEKQIVVREGEKDRREVVAFGARGAAPDLSSGGRVARSPVGDGRAAGAHTALAIATAVLAASGLATAAIFGVEAVSKRDDAVRACPTRCADQAGVDLWRSAKMDADVATVALAAGGALAIGSAVLWWTRPSSRPAPGAEWTIGLGGAGVRGRW